MRPAIRTLVPVLGLAAGLGLLALLQERPAHAQAGLTNTSQGTITVEATGVGSQPTAGTAGAMRRIVGTTEGVLFVMPAPPNQFTCLVAAATAAAQCQAAPGAGLKAYVTDVILVNNAGTAQTIKLVTGTGSNCGTGTANLTEPVQFGAAVGNFSMSFHVALQPPAASAICVTPSAATSVSATLTGYIAP